MKQVINNVNVVEKPKAERQFGMDNLVNCAFAALIAICAMWSVDLNVGYNAAIQVGLFYTIFSALTLADISRKLSNKN